MTSGTQMDVRSPRFVESESATTNHAENHAGSAPVIISLVIVGVLMLLTFAFTNIIGSAMQSSLRYELGNYGYGSGQSQRYEDFQYDLIDLMDDDLGFNPYAMDEDWWSSSAELLQS